MILRLEDQYITDDEKKMLKDLEEQNKALPNILTQFTEEGVAEFKTVKPGERPAPLDEEIQNTFISIFNKREEIMQAVRRRYRDARQKDGLLEDIQRITDAIEKADYDEYIRKNKQSLEVLKEIGVGEEVVKAYLPNAVKGKENCFEYVYETISYQAGELREDETLWPVIREIVNKRVEYLLSDTEPKYIPVARSKATSAYSFMNGKTALIDPFTKDGIIEILAFKVTIEKLGTLRATLGVSTSKLLNYSLSVFARQNDFRVKDKNTLNRNVIIPLREYAEALGYDVTEKITATEEEALLEKKRVKTLLDNVRKTVRKDLSILDASRLTWEEKIHGKPKNFLSQALTSNTGYLNGNIIITFAQEIATYLAESNVITQYPKALLKLDPYYQRTAYYLGQKLADYHNMDSNKIYGKANIISVKSLLKYSNLATYEEVQKKDRGHWEARIKDPFEKALDELVNGDVLEDWKYTHSKSLDLTDDEAYNITSYKDFEDLYITFSFKDEVDDKERLQKKKEAKAKALKRPNKKKSQ